MYKSPILWLFLSLVGIAALAAISPAEKSLGTNVRVVYLHGAWVWVALITFIAAGGVGLIGLITQNGKFHHWSRALGRTGLIFWITYLPLSMWAMQANWNGLFLAEPRWRLAIVFTIAGLLLQIGITLLENPAWASVANLFYIIAIFIALQTTENVMHPASPILNSDARRIQLYFLSLLILISLAAWQVTRWWLNFEPPQLDLIQR